MIGIIVADKNEIFIDQLKLKKIQKINQFLFREFTIGQNDCVIVHSGIGIANAAAAAQMLINEYQVKEIFNYGAVGANHNLNVYDLVAPEKIFYHDVVTPWYPQGQIPHEELFYKNDIKLINKNNLATGSFFVVDKKYWSKLKKDFDVDIVDMEAAAIAQICNKNSISLKVIKCVSDIIGLNNEPIETINVRLQKAGAIAFQKTIEEIRK